MATLRQIDDRKFLVNGKEVYKCMNNKWHSKYLTESEMKEAQDHIAYLNQADKKL